MGDIKMSDMLMLPVKRVNGGVMPFLKDDNDEVMFVGTRYHVDLCVTAINAYDTSQERIADLDELRKNSMACIRSQGDKVIEKSEEIKALKAQVELYKGELESLACRIEYVPLANPHLVDIRHRIKSLNKVSPQQCLADVRADAVDEFIKLVTNKHGNALTLPRLAVCAQQLRDNANESQRNN